MTTPVFDSLVWCLGGPGAGKLLDEIESFGIHNEGASLGLSVDEATALYAYTSSGPIGDEPVYRLVNRGLRFPKSAPAGPTRPLVRAIERALTRMPLFVGVAYRRTDLPDEITQIADAAGTFADAGFLSCSSEPAIWSGRDLVMVRSTRGRRIENLSKYPAEHEVLYPPATEFSVAHLERAPTGAILVLDEV